MKYLNRFMKWYLGENDVEKEPPKDGFFRIIYLVTNFPGKMLMVNLVFILTCIPVITIPAAWTALCAFMGKMYLRGYDFTLEDYFKEFVSGLVKKMIPGILLGGMIFYGYYLMSLSGNFKNIGDDMSYMIIMGAGAGIFGIGIVLSQWVSVMCAHLDLEISGIIRNAAILLFLEWKSSIKLLMTSLLYLFFILAFLPYSIVLPVIMGSSVYCLICCSIICPVIKRRITDPYEDLR